MRLITIEKDHDAITAFDGADRRLRKEFVVTGQVEFYLKGSFDERDYEMARMLALNVCAEMHIPAIQLRRVMPVAAKRGPKRDASQKSLF